MKNIREIIHGAVVKAGSELFGAALTDAQVQLQDTRKEFEGELTLVVFPLVKVAGKSPEETGKIIGEYLVREVPEVSAFNVVKGFLNLVISDAYWLAFFRHAHADGRFGLAEPDSRPRVLVEFASPNTNKPLHLGHLRNIFLGDSVSRLLRAAGHRVTRVQIINDRGIHICKSMIAWMRSGTGETPESSGMKGDKLVGKYYVEFDRAYKAEIAELIAQGKTEDEAKAGAPVMLAAQELLRKWEAKDPETYALWEKMNGWVYAGFDVSYRTMGVEFDKLYFESDTYLLGREEVMKGLEQGVFFRKEDGSIWVDLTEDGLDQKALLRRDGTAMYITQDIGTAILRFRDFPDTAYQIYTVGNEQEYHFKVLFRVLKKLGWEQADRCHHLSYGMVELPEGKMKSREGTVVDADDIMAEMQNVAREVAEEQGKLDGLSEAEKEEAYLRIGMAALKYFLLRVDPVKTMLFNPRESIDFNGHTGPFIQYGYVRTRAILRKAAESGITPGGIPDTVSVNEYEKSLLRRLHEFPAAVADAAARYNPSILANYCYELTRDFNGFYQQCQILREEREDVRNLRIGLVSGVGKVLSTGLDLLGIRMVERM
jgi:arginyl-tRNA synthetase